MRTIKFRAKQLMNGSWVYGDLHLLAAHPHIHPAKGVSYLIKEDTIGQFTGLKDSEGQEIYEGDVLKTNLSDNPFGVVTWHNDGYFFIDCGFGEFPINANGYRPLGEMLVLKLEFVRDVFFEVIGNIHDNTELMKGGAK